MANRGDRPKDKGFWNGGSAAHGSNDQSSGRPSGYPGTRKPSREGVRTDIEFPELASPNKIKK